MYALRWYTLISRLDIGSVNKSYVFRIMLLGEFVSLILPSYLGGDGVRLLKLKERSDATGRIALSIILDRILGLLSLAGLSALCFPILIDLFKITVPSVVWALLVVIIGVVILLLWRLTRPGSPRKLPQWLEQLRSVSLQRRVWLVGIALSSAGHLLFVTGYYVLFSQLASVNYLSIVAISLSSLLTRSLPISILGVEVSDGALIAFVSTIGITPDTALVALSVIIGSRYVFALLGLVTEFLLDGTRFLRTVRKSSKAAS